MNFDQQVQLNFDLLTDNEKEMSFYIKEHKHEVINMSAVEFAEQTLSSKSSVSRLAQKLGFRGFAEMKYAIAQEMKQVATEPTDLISGLKDVINETFLYSEQVNFYPLLDKIKNARGLFIYATGFTQNNYSKEFANSLFLSGRTNFLISGETNFEIISQTLNSEDMVIITSLSGNTPAIKNTIKYLNMSKVPICSVTAFGKSFLSTHSKFQLYYEVSDVPAQGGSHRISMIGLNIILSIFAYKYREFILFDE